MTGDLVTAEPTTDELFDLLTPMQQRFVEAMMETPDYVYAYAVAGGKAARSDHRRTCAHEILTNPNVQKVLRRLRNERMSRTLITSDWVLTKIVQLIERCMQSQPVLDDDGNPTGEYKFDSAGAAKGLQMLMKHMGLFEKDNRQKVGQEQYEAAMARLKARGVDPEKLKALPGGDGGGN